MTIRVLVADDEAMVRVGLRLVLQAEPDLEVVGEACDGFEALAATKMLHPDVVLIDVRMPHMDGLSAAREILTRDAAVKVVVLTTFNDAAYVQKALRLGVSGFMLKVSPPEQLAEAVRIAARGDALLDPHVTRRVIEAFATVPEAETPQPPPLELLTELTPREREVLQMLGRGMSNAEIAAQLVIGEATVKTHVAHVLMKLHLRDRIQAVVFVYEHGLGHGHET